MHLVASISQNICNTSTDDRNCSTKLSKSHIVKAALSFRNSRRAWITLLQRIACTSAYRVFAFFLTCISRFFIIKNNEKVCLIIYKQVALSLNFRQHTLGSTSYGFVLCNTPTLDSKLCINKNKCCISSSTIRKMTITMF